MDRTRGDTEMKVEPHIAYAQGRNTVWYEEINAKCPYEDKETRRHWLAGRRDAIAEERLNMDTEWD